MLLDEKLQTSIKLLGNTTLINTDTYKHLLENCFSVLCNRTEPHNSTTISGSKPDLIKEVYWALLKATLEFVRQDASKDEVNSLLRNKCNLDEQRLELYEEFYTRNKIKLQIVLGNIGNHLPHIVDVQWKIDYIIKTSSLDQFEGPVFRITLITEEYDDDGAEVDGNAPNKQKKKRGEVSFTCDSVELQDLVNKLKEATRHCQRLSVEH